MSRSSDALSSKSDRIFSYARNIVYPDRQSDILLSLISSLNWLFSAPIQHILVGGFTIRAAHGLVELHCHILLRCASIFLLINLISKVLADYLVHLDSDIVPSYLSELFLAKVIDLHFSLSFAIAY